MNQQRGDQRESKEGRGNLQREEGTKTGQREPEKGRGNQRRA